MPKDLKILFANMNRQNSALTMILQTSRADILLIQEPWWGKLVPKCSDSNLEGIEMLGTCCHSEWETFLPPAAPSLLHPHVTIFLQKSLSPFISISVLNKLTSYTCLGLRLDTSPPIFIINFYHHIIDHKSSLDLLLQHPLPSGPLIIGGDFNTHSPHWSPSDLPTSSWAHTLEDWLE